VLVCETADAALMDFDEVRDAFDERPSFSAAKSCE
jgi:hypothetical protein